VLVAAALCTTLQAKTAQAQDAAAQAVSIGREGLALYEQGRWQQAFERFAAADKLYHSPVFVLHMARCRANSGALLEAQSLYKRVSSEQAVGGDTQLWEKTRRDAKSEGSALEARIPILTVQLKDARGQVDSVRVDSQSVSTSVLSAGLQLDPGLHTLQAKDAAGTTAEAQVSLNEGDRREVTLEFIEALQSAGSATPGRSTQPDAQVVAVKWPAIVALSVGAAGIAAGTVTGLLAKRDADAVLEGCDSSSNCDPRDESQWERGRRFATISTIGFAAGGAFLAAGAALLIWPPHTTVTQDTAVSVAPTFGGAVIHGSF
jgi:tetratricopeptide (TPR) repeat protein